MRQSKISRLLSFAWLWFLPLTACAETLHFSPADQAKFERIERAVPAHLSLTTRVDRISAHLLGTPYLANTLIGSSTTPESLVIRFDGVDCYTFVDLVRAMSVSDTKAAFIQALKETRYRNAQVTFLNRRHFLTDWWAMSPHNAVDITASLSPLARTVSRTLNLRGDGGHYIEGLPVVHRDMTYLAPEALTDTVIARIHTGDIIGIYTKLPGLDVTHTGLAIWKDGSLYFRNASSLKKNMKVVDSLLRDYVQGKPGILVMRMLPRE